MMKKNEAAERYNVSLREIDSLLSDGVLPKVKLGRRCVRIPIKEADHAMKAIMTGGSGKEAA